MVNEEKLDEFGAREKPLAVLRTGVGIQTGEFTTGVFQGGTVWAGPLVHLAKPLPMAILAAEHYNRIGRLLARKVPVKVQLEIRTEVDETYKNESFNVIGEIPGGAKKEEIVMVGAHLDSWPFATGATDNAIGCAVAMEAMRILRSLKMDRTVRLALWGGEEQGRLGSRAYVKEHFANRADMRLKPEHEELSAYFNIDGGSGRIRGIYLRRNEMARPIFENWFVALKDLTSGAVSIRDIDDEKPAFSDHMSFDEVGLPGFQFLQDPLDFETRSLHTNMDTFDRIQTGDSEQMAVVVASFLYNAATRSEKLPRKELPAPQQPASRR
ncbi:MAG: M20/M25/M40 family metallo-hydrolase [Acidobacteriota bacterium]|nr:M20/M25/M40 family metallo-hydrolase [Acidobacteriota bacterium]